MTCCPLVPPAAATGVTRLIQPGSATSWAGCCHQGHGKGNRIMTSADGLNWTVRSSPADLGCEQQRRWQPGDGEPLNHD